MLSPLLVTQSQHRWNLPGTGFLMLLFFPLSMVCFVLACVDYAKSKGLPPAMGLLGIASIFGLVILAVWPDRYKFDREAQREKRKLART